VRVSSDHAIKIAHRLAFAFGNPGYRELWHRNSHQPAINSRPVPLNDATCEIAVERLED